MAVTVAAISKVKADVTARRRVCKTVTFDNSYPTGGEPVTAAQFGLSRVLHAMPAKIVSGFAAGFAHCDPILQTDGSIKLRLRAAAGTEVPDTTDASTVVCVVEVEGWGG